jgi:hypothetical protein
MTTHRNDGGVALVPNEDPGCGVNTSRLVEVRAPEHSSVYTGLLTWRIRQLDSASAWAVRDESPMICSRGMWAFAHPTEFEDFNDD